MARSKQASSTSTTEEAKGGGRLCTACTASTAFGRRSYKLSLLASVRQGEDHRTKLD